MSKIELFILRFRYPVIFLGLCFFSLNTYLIYDRYPEKPELLIAGIAMFLSSVVCSFYLSYRRAKKLYARGDLKIKRRKKTYKPGYFSVFFAGIIQQPDDREAALGCLETRYKLDVNKRGIWYARAMWWADIFRALPSGAFNTFRRVFKWALWGYILEKFISK